MEVGCHLHITARKSETWWCDQEKNIFICSEWNPSCPVHIQVTMVTELLALRVLPESLIQWWKFYILKQSAFLTPSYMPKPQAGCPLLVGPQLSVQYVSSYPPHLEAVAMRLMTTVQFLVGTKKSFSTPQHPDKLWGSPSLLSNGYQGSFSKAWCWPLTSI
jgi:hypothetical protein